MTKRCCTCKVEKDVSEFYRASREKDGFGARCKGCSKTYAQGYYQKNIERFRVDRKVYNTENSTKVMCMGAAARSRKRGVPFELTPEDIVIPETCPVLGWPLESNDGVLAADSPSVDCIIPSLGYTVKNTWVISHRANMIKNNATPAELKAVVNWLEKQLA